MWTSRWNKESFRVGYSTTGADPADFIWLTDQPETVTSVDDSWKKREYAIPAAARHVCINYCTPENGYWFMVDDIYIGAPAATPAVRAARRADAAPADAPTFKNFDVYVDGAKVASTPATSHVVKGLAEGHHTARVVAVYIRTRRNRLPRQAQRHRPGRRRRRHISIAQSGSPRRALLQPR